MTSSLLIFRRSTAELHPRLVFQEKMLHKNDTFCKYLEPKYTLQPSLLAATRFNLLLLNPGDAFLFHSRQLFCLFFWSAIWVYIETGNW